MAIRKDTCVRRSSQPSITAPPRTPLLNGTMVRLAERFNRETFAEWVSPALAASNARRPAKEIRS